MSNARKAVNSEIIYRYILVIWLILGYIWTVRLSFIPYNENNIWIVGDWLINYQGGFVRRGIIGQLVYFLSVVTHITPKIYVLILHWFFYFVYFFSVGVLILRSNSVLKYYLIVFSPFLMTFQILDYQGGFRKEIIFFALLSSTAVIGKIFEKRTFRKFAHFVFLFYPVLVFSHEALVIYFPYFIVLYLLNKNENEDLLRCFVYSLPTFISFMIVVSYTYLNTEDSPLVVEAIIDSYNELSDNFNYDKFKRGAIGLLTGKLVEQAKIFPLIINYHYIQKYLTLLIISMIPLIPLLDDLKYILKNRKIRMIFFVPLFLTFLLFFVQLDWGRHITINLVAIFILSIFVDQNFELSSKFDKSRTGIYVFLFSLIYSASWHMPHCCDRGIVAFDPLIYRIFKKAYLIIISTI